MMQADVHVWKTADGRLVLAGDPDGAVLAYAPGDDVPARDEDRIRALTTPEDEPVKQAAKPEGKQAAKGADKAVQPEANK